MLTVRSHVSTAPCALDHQHTTTKQLLAHARPTYRGRPFNTAAPQQFPRANASGSSCCCCDRTSDGCHRSSRALGHQYHRRVSVGTRKVLSKPLFTSLRRESVNHHGCQESHPPTLTEALDRGAARYIHDARAEPHPSVRCAIRVQAQQRRVIAIEVEDTRRLGTLR